MSASTPIGVVADLQAFAEAVAAANPRHARRILGNRAAKPASVTAPIVLAVAPKKSGNVGRARKYPWCELAINEWFDVDAAQSTRRLMGKQTRMAFKRYGRRFGVKLATNRIGRGVIRVTRTA